MNNILVVGLGYIGLPLALRLAELGHTVYGEDIDADRRKCVEGKYSPWPSEPVIAEKMAATSLTLWNGEEYDTIIFCIPIDTESCEQLLSIMKRYNLEDKLIVVESTLPLNGTDKVMAAIPDSAKFAYAPERLTAGKLWHNLTNESRVIGGDLAAVGLYQGVVRSVMDIIYTDLRTAEISKLAENAYRYEKIDFANRLAMRCQDMLQGDVWRVVDTLNELGIDLPNPGAGIGGYCLEKDYEFLRLPKDRDHAAWMVRNHTNKYDRIVFLGEAYKANVSDVRNSPIFNILMALPPNQSYVIVDQTDLLPLQCDVVIIVQRHSIYKEIDWRGLDARLVIDLCGFFQLDMMLPVPENRKWDYVCLGIGER